MLNRAARFDWLLDHNQMHPSVLGRRIGRKFAASPRAGATDEDEDDDEAGRSRATDDQIHAFVDAWHTGDGAGQKDALNRIVEGWRADNAAGGVPVHAHLPLPKDFAKTVARLVGEPDDAAGEPMFANVIADLDPGVQAMVARQITGLLNRKDSASLGHDLRDRAYAEERRNHEDGLVPWVRDSAPRQAPRLQEHLTSLLQRFEMERARRSHDETETVARSFGGLLESEPVRDAVDGLGTAGDEARDRTAWRTMEYDETRDDHITAEASPWNGQRGQVQPLQGAPFNQPPKQEPPRIVRPYRRYSSPGLTPEKMAKEDRDADALARDADVYIRELVRAIEADEVFAGDRDPLVLQFLQSLKRYFAENGDRAVVSPAPGDRRASMHSKDHLAAYDPSSDRIVFSSLFKSLSREEKIITLMHELLHTTPIAKNEAARSGSHRDRKGGMTYAKHEAWLDNLAIRLAKRLKLIPQNYPETSWKRYYEA